MLTILKSGVFFLCTSILLHSCYPASISSRTTYTAVSNTKDAPVGKHNILRNDIPVRAMRQVLKCFPAADNINWQKSVPGWIAAFKAGMTETSMNFDANGDWSRIYSIYAKAPEDIRKLIDKKFKGYQISNVYSITTFFNELDVSYSIVICKENNWKVLELCNGVLSVFTDINRHS